MPWRAMQAARRPCTLPHVEARLQRCGFCSARCPSRHAMTQRHGSELMSMLTLDAYS